MNLCLPLMAGKDFYLMKLFLGQRITLLNKMANNFLLSGFFCIFAKYL